MNLPKIQVCNEISALQLYLGICVRALDKCAPKKFKNVRANNIFFMNTKISKAILDHIRLRKKILKKFFI